MKYPRYPEYKNSGIEWLGEVPAHWEVQPIKHLGWLKGGSGFPHVDQGAQGEELDFHKVNALGAASADGVLNPSENTISTETAQRLGAFVFPKRSIVFAKVGAALLLGRVRELGAPACIDNNMMGLVVAQRKNEVSFVRYSMNTVRFDYLANPGAVPSLNEAQIGNFKLPIPPNTEQKTIAAFLDHETAKLDTLIAKQERLIALLQEKRQALISHAVTKGLDPNVPMKDSGIEWLGDVPAHWKITRIKRLTRSLEQGWSPQCEGYPIDSNEDWGILKVGCVNGGKFNPIENKAFPRHLEPMPSLGILSGDVLISRANTRELVGSAALAEKNHPKLMLCDKLYRLRLFLDTCLPKFLVRYLCSANVRGQIELAATGASSSMLNIAQSTILELEIGIPPLDEQTALVAFLDHETAKIDKLIDKARRSIELMREHRSALISAAVTGKIDVRDHATA